MTDDNLFATLGRHGGARRKGEQGANSSTLKRGGSSKAYILARLVRDQRYDLLAEIEERRTSAFAVACRLGWAKRPPRVGQRVQLVPAQRQHGPTLDHEDWSTPQPVDVTALIA